ncbi:MAG: tRNA (adenosine(37)-N6)-dimethylallyltransferase MiaA [Pseudomonadota bacterium]
MTSPPLLTIEPLLKRLDPALPVLIAGPTASGKSSLALHIARQQGGTIINADASQVYACWRVLTARPSVEEEALAPHRLYGHVPAGEEYSAGHWLRDLRGILTTEQRPIIVGGTGLYFSALTVGLAEIPPTPADVRRQADAMDHPVMLDEIDAPTRARIDTQNPARVQRAWEVLRSTGRGLAAWQDETERPLLPVPPAQGVVVNAPKEWLTPRIERRFDQMIDAGALEEVRAVLPTYDPALPAHRAIGAPELIRHLRGEAGFTEARNAAIVATRQYAKRQRTWFRSKMHSWMKFDPAG